MLHAAPPRITALDARPPHLHGRTGANLAPELACLRGHVDNAVLAAAALRAQQIGVGADRVLIANGDVRESTYLQFFCAAYGAQYSTLKTAQREDCPLKDEQLIEAARAGILPIRTDKGLCWTIAPRGVAAKRLAALLDAHPGLAPRIQLASTRHFDEFILRIAHDALGEQAANGLASKRPDLSAAPQIADRSWRRKCLRTAKVLALGAVLAAIPKEMIGFGGDGLACWFLGFIGLRLVASLIRRPTFPKPTRVPDRELPVYTIIAALYRESESVAGLIHALQALDYPAEKLDIKIAIEADDLATRAAIEKLNPPDHIEIIIAPNIGPRTKPKALNCALNFARGSFTVVFDAEDRPEPDQLRKALDAFRQHGDDVVCAQASLCIDNGGDSWLSRMFAAEYAGQFDVFLPGFSAMRLPLPLGGSSNHFRTQALRQAGAWDAYNVTEDADLGLRLARFGFRSVMIGSTTFEEAPARFGAWLRQRTRWLKGWMQTWTVHMRAPRALWREIGPRGFITLQLAIGGNVVAALVHPFFVLALIVEAAYAAAGATGGPLEGAFGALHNMAIASGYLGSMVIGWMGLERRGMRASIWVLALMPIYWLCLSLAAWRALFQLMSSPYRWEKTDHGLARTSQFANKAMRSKRPAANAAPRVQK